MTNTANPLSFKVTDGPVEDDVVKYLRIPGNPKQPLLCKFSVEIYNGDTLVDISQISCRFETIAHYKDSTWIFFLRVKVADKVTLMSKNHRYMAVAYNTEQRCGPARFDYRSLLDFPKIIGSEKAGIFIA